MNDETSFNPFSLSGRRILVTGASSGLGLAIASEIARRHGVTISVASEEGRGTVFTFAFPSNEA